MLNVALIGCGRVAGHHCRSLENTAGISLAAVCDLDLTRAGEYADQYGVQAYSNYHEMLSEHPDVDIVSIITPSGMHFAHTMDVLENYEKHVVVEKPTFMRLSHLDAAYTLAGEKGVNVFPVFQNRYNKAVRRVKKALDGGEVGDIRLVSVRVRWCRPQSYYDLAPWRGTFSHDGGALTNQGIHHVDLARYLCGEVTNIHARMRTLGAEIEVEDTIVATFGYESGAMGVLEVTTAARPDDFEASLSIVGSEGLIQIGGVAVNELQIFTPDPEECERNSENFLGIKGHGAVYGFGHGEMYHDIVRHLSGDQDYPVSREDCRATLELLHGFYRADEAGEAIKVRPGKESARLGRDNEDVSALYRTESAA